MTQRLILSARKYFPAMPIYVADQSYRIDAMEAFYRRHDVTLVRMPYDIGVTSSRNALARAVAEDYFVLCDDDFIFDRETSFDAPLRLLDAVPEIGVAGGRLFDFYGTDEHLRRWEMYLQYDPEQKILFSVPISQLAPRARQIAGVRYYLCDAVLNFAVMRRSMFDAGIRWDERFKSNGEHEDFFLNMKVNSPFKAAHVPAMVAFHHHPETYLAYRSRLRERCEGWRLFLEKWGLEQHIEFGLGVRTLDDPGKTFTPEEAGERFFVNADLSLARQEAPYESLLVGEDNRIDAIGALDGEGRVRGAGRKSARLVINVGDSTLAPVTETDPNPDGSRSSDIYRLEGQNDGQAVSSTDAPLFFRYDPVLREDADFLLWHACGSWAGDSSRRLAVAVRWYAADGTCLVWRGRRSFIDLDAVGYWRPLLLDLPVMPRSCLWLRFEVVADGGSSPDAICTGFLFPHAIEALPHDVLALGRLPHDGSEPSADGQPLDLVGSHCPRLDVAIEESPVIAGLSLIRLKSLPGFEVLYFSGWEAFGRRLVTARLPRGTLSSPAFLALPGEGWRQPGAALYGFGGPVGFAALEPQIGAPSAGPPALAATAGRCIALPSASPN